MRTEHVGEQRARNHGLVWRSTHGCADEFLLRRMAGTDGYRDLRQTLSCE